MDAIRVARAFTGRETIVKMFGSYHGITTTSWSASARSTTARSARVTTTASLPYGGGIPQASIDMTIPAPFNDSRT